MISTQFPEEYGPLALLDYFEASAEALQEHETGVLRNATSSQRYINFTPAEVQQAFRHLREELKREVVLSLLASIEAKLRLDFQERTKRRGKDPISRQFREIKKIYGDRVRLDDIINSWKAMGFGKEAFQRLGQFRKHRHWLAHGRYWTDKSGVSNDPYEVYDILQALAIKIPDFPSFQ